MSILSLSPWFVRCAAARSASEQAPYPALLALRELRLASEAPRPACGLLLEQVAAESLAATELARAGHLHALLRVGVRLHLRHLSSPRSAPPARPPQAPSRLPRAPTR